MSKGSTQRPRAISAAEWRKRWKQTFENADETAEFESEDELYDESKVWEANRVHRRHRDTERTN